MKSLGLVDIRVLDHMVIGDGETVSFAESRAVVITAEKFNSSLARVGWFLYDVRPSVP